MKIMHKVTITKCAFPLDREGTVNYVATLWTSVDGGQNYYHCGHGKYCRTEQEAREYAASVTETEEA